MNASGIPRAVGMLALIGLISPAPVQAGAGDTGSYVIDRLTGLPVKEVNIPRPAVAPNTTTSYLCWSGTGTLASTGVLQALFTTGTNTLCGDDAHMNATGLLGAMGFSIANKNPSGGHGLSEADGEIAFFRQSNNTLIGAFPFTANLTAILGAPLAAQSSFRLSFAEGSLESLNIILDTPDIFITTKFTTVRDDVGAPNNNVGIQIRNPAGGPAAPGASSQDRMMINGVDTTSPFGGSPVGNTSYFVRVSPVVGVVAWRSVRFHSGIGLLAIPLNPTATGNDLTGPTVETRVGGIQRIEVDFNQAVSVGNAAAVVTTGRTTIQTGQMEGPVGYTPISVAMMDSDTMVITYAAAPAAGDLPNQTCYNINIAGAVNAPGGLGGDTDVNVRALMGDTNMSGEVILEDVLFTKSRIIAGDLAANAPQHDVTVNGSINLSDALFIKSRFFNPPPKALCP